MLSAVGLLPIAAAGISIDDLMKGAADSMDTGNELKVELYTAAGKVIDNFTLTAKRPTSIEKISDQEILDAFDISYDDLAPWSKISRMIYSSKEFEAHTDASVQPASSSIFLAFFER